MVCALLLGLFAGTFAQNILFLVSWSGSATYARDFLAFYSTSELISSGQADQAYDMMALSDQIARHMHQSVLLPWMYPPNALWLVQPWAYLPLPVAWALFLLLSLLLLVVTAWPWLKRPDPLALMAFPGLWVALFYGQNSLITVALAFFVFRCLAAERHIGACLSLIALTFKPQLGLLWPVVLGVQRRWALMAAVALGSGVWMAVSVWFFGQSAAEAFWHSLNHSAQLVRDEMPHEKMISTYAALRSWSVVHPIALSLQGMVAVWALMTLVAIVRRGTARDISSAFALATLLVTPYAYEYELIWLALFLLTFEARTRADRRLVQLLWLLPLGQFFGSAEFDWVNTLTVSCLILALLHCRQRLQDSRTVVADEHHIATRG